MKRRSWIVAALALAPIAACGGDDDASRAPGVRGEGEPRRVVIERILISYRGNPLGIESRRTLSEARELARRICDRARAGEKFESLRDGYSDDRLAGAEVANGAYVFLNYDVPMAPTLRGYGRLERAKMGRRLGDRAFQMRVGEIALIEYDEQDYEAGYEIVLCKQRDERTEEEVARDLARPRDPPGESPPR